MLGAWSLTQQPVDTLLEPGLWAAMVACMTASGRAGVRRERGRLWLWGEEVVEGGAAVAAAEGFVPGDGVSRLVEAARRGEALCAPVGHYALVCADGRSVTLMRSLSGGERLYVARVGEVVLFASSVRPLLVHPAVGGRLDLPVVDQVLINGVPVFGQATAIAGVDEVQPGTAVTLTDGVGRQRWHTPEALVSPVGGHRELAAAFRERLIEAVVLGAGRERPVAVALSGGIDSSAIAAAAVEAFGADAIAAYTYEFDDETHPVETHYARAVAERLGIGRHRVFKLPFEGFLAAIPEMVWRSESPVHWPKAFMLQVARHLRQEGHSRYLTGFGIGSHMAFFEELATVLEAAPRLRTAMAYWKTPRFVRTHQVHKLRYVHPGLEPPHPRLYYMLVRLLHHAGLLPEIDALYPEAMAPMVRRLGDLDELEPDLEGLGLKERFQQVAFAHLISCVDVTRPEKASREAGVHRVSPAHFAPCIPYAYLPPSPPPPVWSRARHLRPGKYLLRLAFGKELPDEVVYRKKSWGDAVASPRWLRQGRIAMLRALPGFPWDFDRFGEGYAEAMAHWEPRSILASGLGFRLWERMFVESPHLHASPTWESLGGRLEAAGCRLQPSGPEPVGVGSPSSSSALR